MAALHREEEKVDEDKDKKLTFEEAKEATRETKKKHPVFSVLKVVDAGTRWDYEYAASPGKKEEGQGKENGEQSAVKDKLVNLGFFGSDPKDIDKIVGTLRSHPDSDTISKLIVSGKFDGVT